MTHKIGLLGVHPNHQRLPVDHIHGHRHVLFSVRQRAFQLLQCRKPPPHQNQPHSTSPRKPLGCRRSNAGSRSGDQNAFHLFKETKRPGLRRAFLQFKYFRLANLTECRQEFEQVSRRDRSVAVQVSRAWVCNVEAARTVVGNSCLIVVVCIWVRAT